jgi:hypothetical protein
MNSNVNINDFVTTNYLFRCGFRRDKTAPEGIIRMKHNRICDHHISITFEVNTELGFFVANYGFFHRNDKYNRITRKYHFKDMVLTIAEFEAIMLDVFGTPRNVKNVLKHNNIKD